MRINPFKKLSYTTKTILLCFVSLYLSFALLLYQIWDSSPPGIIGGLFTSFAAILDSIFGIALWFIIIVFYTIMAIRLKFINPINASKPALVIMFIAISCLSNDGAIAGIINTLFEPLFGEMVGKAIQFFILIICGVIILNGSTKKSLKGFAKKLRNKTQLFGEMVGKAVQFFIREKQTTKKDKNSSLTPKRVKKLSPALVKKPYSLPSLALLEQPIKENSVDHDSLKMRAIELEKSIMPFEHVKVNNWIEGPMATTFYTQLEADTKVSRLLSRINDIARSLGLDGDSVRISGNIEGQKNTIGIELPNPERKYCSIRKVLEHPSYKESDYTLPLALGIGIDGKYVCEDLSALPHLLLAGSSGSGKTVALNVILLSLIFKKTPEELNLVLIDPKMVEFSLYKGIPHLLGDVVTDMDESVHVLEELIEEMEKRYQTFQDVKVTKISEYNLEVKKNKRMPHIAVFIDELGDLMLSHGKRVEDLLGRLSQKARAAGIHLVLATQRPTSDIIKGLIKANVPARLAFKVSNHVDSRVILDAKGAESMLGKGDCLLSTTENKSLKRIQSPLVTTDEIKRVVSEII